MHVVIVDEELPHPPNSGKRLRILGLVRHLAKRHRLTFLCHQNTSDEDAQGAAKLLAAFGIETIYVKRQTALQTGRFPLLRFGARLGLNLLSSVPYSVQWNNCPRLREAVRRYNRNNEVDIWQVEWAPYATAFLGASGMNWAMMAHDIQSFTWERYYRHETNLLKRWYIKKQWERYRRYESRVFSEAQMTITVSDEDRQRVREHFSARRTTVVDNGVDVAHYQAIATGQYPRNGSEILFLGNLEWRPNLDAVRLLLDEVFPAVLAAEPSARLCIVGRRPPAWLLRRGSEAAQIEVHADVHDVRPFLYRCGAMAVPLRIGGGSRLKILEALACGMPVVASSVGAEGLRLQPGEHFALANQTSEMARVLIEWMRNPAAARAQAEAGRAVVEARYDWSVLAEKMESAWDELVGCSCQSSHPQMA
jgi:glycosyltransferase involved in cell wall biosynthesis